MRKYLLVDVNGRSRRGQLIEVERANVSRQYRSKILSQNIWECADSPLMAVMMNPLHAECVLPRLFELRGNVEDNQFTLHQLHEITVPRVSPEQKLAFSMYCVSASAFDRVFIAWVDRWLTGGDRSLAGVQLIRRQLAESAERGDRSLAVLSEFGARASEINRLYDSEFEFLRRACDVVDAAAALLEKPHQWQVMLSERVATATRNVLGDLKQLQFAKLAIQLMSDEIGKRQMSEPKLLLRRREDDQPRKPNVRAYAVYHRGELRIKGRSRTKPDDKTS